MPQTTDDFSDYVLHPRYGRGPNVTGLNPRYADPGIHLHRNATSLEELAERYRAVMGRPIPYLHVHQSKLRSVRIPNTAVAADLSKQTPATVPVTHYFDVDQTCRDCGRKFIFFANEQKHWYEELGFGLDSDCVRCVPCRKKQQGIARTRERYEELFHVENRTVNENLEMAECCLDLIEAGLFTRRQTERVRMLLNLIATKPSDHVAERVDAACHRVLEIERSN